MGAIVRGIFIVALKKRPFALWHLFEKIDNKDEFYAEKFTIKDDV